MKYIILLAAWFGLSMAVFATEPPTKHLTRETTSQVQEVTKLHTQINRCSALTVLGGVGAAFFPPAIAVSGVASVVRFFKVNKHRRLTNELLRKSL